MFSKKVSLFVIPFLCIMIIANLFVLPIYANDRSLDYVDYDNPVGEVKEGELIYLIAQANGIKFYDSSSSNLFSALANAYKKYQSYNPVLTVLEKLVGTFYKVLNSTKNSFLNVSNEVYNDVTNFLRNSFGVNGIGDVNSFTLKPLPYNNFSGGTSFNSNIFYIYPDNSLKLSYVSSSKDLYVDSKSYCKDSDNHSRCLYGGDYNTSKTFLFFSNRGFNRVFIVASPVAFTHLEFTYIYNGSLKIESRNSSHYTDGLFDFYYVVFSSGLYNTQYPLLYPGCFHVNNTDNTSALLPDIARIFFLYNFDFGVNYAPDYNVNNIVSSSSTVVINNVTIVNNNVVINNNGTDVPIDDNVKDTVVAPTPPDVKPYDVTVDLNNIDVINKYHNDMELKVNDFLIQFNDNLNKIDTNCYSLTSCAINGLKLVGNVVNDITGYSEKGMNSDIVLLICLFLLLGILFTIL